ncbi:hypothetical protein M427DRAFT_181666 [Gonapodya prolifera JEL478]|uniref:Uncharacterized protein n=1 Tax=Gonapodya prolifera (strain JEL478) TaxID=1344416 RepID=A0A139AQK4_GONPJ|nr:hypothetical protein M427DRAFT_181666 [Gonapodya prolifera JEL478]|eukprot:KXS19041.1 hypothetical protein M427DRAFT_181666 [Gonapodya prolifera JEL478]
MATQCWQRTCSVLPLEERWCRLRFAKPNVLFEGVARRRSNEAVRRSAFEFVPAEVLRSQIDRLMSVSKRDCCGFVRVRSFRNGAEAATSNSLLPSCRIHQPLHRVVGKLHKHSSDNHHSAHSVEIWASRQLREESIDVVCAGETQKRAKAH